MPQGSQIHGYASPSHCAARHQLQRAVHKYFGFKPPGSAKHDPRHGQPGSNTGLKFRLNGKTGRMRGSLLGWRLGDVARCVAQPAPAGFEVDVVIVPQSIAKSLGNLQDGAVCLLNRQPTLGVGSIFAVRARVSRNPRSYVLQVSPWLCATLNLDFDGDEVNLHVIKSAQAQFEARLLCGLDSIMRYASRNARLKPCRTRCCTLVNQRRTTTIAPQDILTRCCRQWRAAAGPETALRQVAVSVGLSDVPVPSHMLGAVTSVPKSQRCALAQILALELPRGGLGTLVRSRAKGKFRTGKLKACLGQQLRYSSGTAKHAGTSTGALRRDF